MEAENKALVAHIEDLCAVLKGDRNARKPAKETLTKAERGVPMIVSGQVQNKKEDMDRRHSYVGVLIQGGKKRSDNVKRNVRLLDEQ